LCRAAIAGVVLCSAACGTPTSIKSSWHDPTITSLKFRKMVVIGLNPDEKLRRSMETAMAQNIPGSVPSYTFIPQADLPDKEKVKAAVQATDCDGAVIMRLVGVDKETTYVPGSATYGGMWGYYGYGAGMVYDPGYYQTDKLYSVETNVYSVRDAKLVYSSRSETTSPDSLNDLIQSVVQANADHMRSQKLM
jgi:hypothetical protein